MEIFNAIKQDHDSPKSTTVYAGGHIRRQQSPREILS